MKTFGRYFGYITKKSILRTVIFTLIAFAIVFASMQAGLEPSYWVGDDGTVHDNRVTNLGEISTVLGFVCGIIPIIELAGFKSRRNIDVLYSFPIKRWKMATAHYLSGILQITAIHSVCFFTSYIYYLINTDCFALEYMIPYFFASLGLGIIMYSVFMFINSQANTVIDGVLFSVLWIFALYFILELIIGTYYEIGGIKYHIPYDYYYSFREWGKIYGPLNNVTVIFRNFIRLNQNSGKISPATAEYISQLYMILVWIVLGIGAIFGYFLTFIKKSAQKSGEISASFFGYRTLIPLYCMAFFAVEDGWINNAMTFAAMIVGFVIFRRGFRFKLPDILSMVGAVLIGIVLMVVRSVL